MITTQKIATASPLLTNNAFQAEQYELHELSKDQLISTLRELEATRRAEKEAERKKHEIVLKELEEREAKTEAALKETDAARKRFSSVIDDLNNEKEALKMQLKKPGAASPSSDFRPLDLENPCVTKFNANVVSKSSTTTNCSFETTIHEPPEEVLAGKFLIAAYYSVNGQVGLSKLAILAPGSN